ncbi:MAG: hypothetical protein JNK05_16820 [Myxococcales bacterium]|nr:hypothetical protein [Myxococcales bacterium]
MPSPSVPVSRERAAALLIVCACALAGCGAGSLLGDPVDGAQPDASDGSIAMDATTPDGSVVDVVVPGDGCVAGTMCTNPANPCETGVFDCTSGRCAGPFAPARDGVACAGGVCSGGVCRTPTMCVAGQACVPMEGPCWTGNTACPMGPSGPSQCMRGAAQPSGSLCGGTNVCDGAGMCRAPSCTAGVRCNPTGMPCLEGVSECRMGALGPQTCGMTRSVSAGVSCGGTNVCDGRGNCGAPTCVVGAACTPPGMECRTGTVTCPGGATGPISCSVSGNVARNTPCATGFCNGTGACVAATCTAGAMCAPPGLPCRTGTVTCPTGPLGSASCTATGNAATATPCGGSNVCNGSGACVTPPCVAGASCTPTNPCLSGTTSCPAGPFGATSCTAGAALPLYSACGAGMVCNASSTCVARCVDPGTACFLGGNRCQNGINRCSTPVGPAACMFTSNVAAGTPCLGPGMQSCDGNGNCVPDTPTDSGVDTGVDARTDSGSCSCVAGSDCHPDPCLFSPLICDTGCNDTTPQCGLPTNEPNTTRCMSTGCCSSGSCTTSGSACGPASTAPNPGVEGGTATDTNRCGHSYRISTTTCPATCNDGGFVANELCGVGNWGRCRNSTTCVLCTVGNSCTNPCATGGITACQTTGLIPRCAASGAPSNEGGSCAHTSGVTGVCSSGQCCLSPGVGCSALVLL